MVIRLYGNVIWREYIDPLFIRVFIKICWYISVNDYIHRWSSYGWRLAPKQRVGKYEVQHLYNSNDYLPYDYYSDYDEENEEEEDNKDRYTRGHNYPLSTNEFVIHPYNQFDVPDPGHLAICHIGVHMKNNNIILLPKACMDEEDVMRNYKHTYAFDWYYSQLYWKALWRRILRNCILLIWLTDAFLFGFNLYVKILPDNIIPSILDYLFHYYHQPHQLHLFNFIRIWVSITLSYILQSILNPLWYITLQGFISLISFKYMLIASFESYLYALMKYDAFIVTRCVRVVYASLGLQFTLPPITLLVFDNHRLIHTDPAYLSIAVYFFNITSYIV